MMMPRTEPTVEVRNSGAIAHIRFAKPPHNFACPQLLGMIADAVEQADAEAGIVCTVLEAEGKAFCGGADLAGDENVAGADGMVAVGKLYEQAGRLFRRRKPMVAAIQGAAIGAGLGLALAADFRVAGPGARLAANFTRLGFHPGFALTYTLPRLIGVQKAAWVLLSSERVKPDDALAMGLVDRLAGEDDLFDVARSMAEAIAVNAPLAVVDVRATLMEGFVAAATEAMKHEHARQTVLKATKDYAEGVASVFERRDAVFIGA